MVSVRQSHVMENAYCNAEQWLEQLAVDGDKRQRLTRVNTLVEKWADSETQLLNKGREMVDILHSLNMDADSLCAALVFPLLQNERVTKETISEQLGNELVNLLTGVEQMDAIKSLQSHKGTQQTTTQVDNLRKMLMAMVEDVRAVVIKLAERVCYLIEVKNADEETRVLAAKETTNVFAPLANRLGIGQLKWELEDLSFRYLHPKTYKEIAGLLEEKRLDREQYVVDFVSAVDEKLKQLGVKAEVYGRPKHIYSIFKKMRNKHYNFEQLYDIRAIRIIADSVQDCYGALGVIHTAYKHIPSEFDDYIATPKANGYQSIHTVVFGPNGKSVEVQIRTQQMHEDAELGVAAHWKYKEGSFTSKTSGYDDKINWLRQLLQWQEDVADSSDFADEVRNQVIEDRVYVFTPKGDIFDLPIGSTPLDFAYYIHSNVGHRCIGAKVFGRIVPFTYKLNTGDQVEILTSKQPNPSRDWLNPNSGFINSSRARAKVHTWFKSQDKDKNLAAGREMLEAELTRLELKLKDASQAVKRFNMKSLDDLMAAIGAGDVRLNQVTNYLHSQFKKQQDEESEIDPRLKHSQKTKKTVKSSVVIEGVGNLLSHMAKCCQPVTGDTIYGYITLGRGIAIHRDSCEQFKQSQAQHPERVVEAQWGDGYTGGYEVTIKVVAQERNGLLRDVTAILANEKISVSSMNMRIDDKKQLTTVEMELEVHNTDAFKRVMSKLKHVEDVIEVKRGQ
ncbi:GTP diphosphokinase [Flocculibacter collagenilyticus]|uniref:GTP diphosphokinase n=1 Tax=Flocculibacter collagenilyticus TaxID=2744479 RepID=UPI0018F62800|nr:GTP diphosphokinase [Flocculibacter collagenilyticus]